MKKEKVLSPFIQAARQNLALNFFFWGGGRGAVLWKVLTLFYLEEN